MKGRIQMTVSVCAAVIALSLSASLHLDGQDGKMSRYEIEKARAEAKLEKLRIREEQKKANSEERRLAREEARYVRENRRNAKTARKKLQTMKDEQSTAGLALPKDDETAKEYAGTLDMSRYRDTIKIKGVDGEEQILMRAVKDDETGEMVANEMLDAAVVSARFRNVAERHGKIRLSFDVRVPASMQDTKWQLRIMPTMEYLGRSYDLDPIHITGSAYRRAQLRGYQRYENFLKKIVDDPLYFIDIEQLERFLMRNIPQLYALKDSQEEVTDEEFASIYGVTEKDAVAHYTSLYKINRNNRLKSRREEMYRRFVKAPIDTVGLRLDSIVVNSYGEFVYCYTEVIKAEKDLRKVDVTLAGQIYEQEKQLYTIPRSEPLTFYIASLANFVDPSPRYLLQVVERHAEANAEYSIEFEAAKADIKTTLGDNAAQIWNIRRDLQSILNNDTFILDSIMVTSYASPEGAVALNRRYCTMRSDAFGKYFGAYVRQYRDSLIADRGLMMTEDGRMVRDESDDVDVRFQTVIGGENWAALDNYVEMDGTLSDEDKADYFSYAGMNDPDGREMKIRGKGYYPYLRSTLYPKTRTVNCRFMLHRKGMTKDTVHTTVLDSAYMKGVQALKDRDFETAVNLLRPYQDYNTAVAFVAMDYNISALGILEKLPATAQTEYMMAIIRSRQGLDQEAVQHYVNAVGMEPSYRHRGNLDPEISVLIQRYNLNAEPEDEFGDLGF